MSAILFASVAIECAWIAATVTFVLNGHNGWAVACFIGALVSGYAVTERKS